tara:strand:+ start:535 stop:912 length:378 start_codon:yes stop_codon:yes gene_type:complete
MKIRDLTGDQVGEGIGSALWKGAKAVGRGARDIEYGVRQGVKNQSSSFNKGFGVGVDAKAPDYDWYKRKGKGTDASGGDKPQAKKPQTGNYQKKTKIIPELEAELSKMSPEEQQAFLDELRQGAK